MSAWHLLTGEYPPRPGGISDHAALVASGLARDGAAVHVWTVPGCAGSDEPAGVTVHPVAGRWSPSDLARLGNELDAHEAPRRLLVQYAPSVWGYKGLNLAFCRWLQGRARRGDDVRVMFHEVWYPLKLRERPRRWVLAIGQRAMARMLMRAASHVYVSTTAWTPLLRASGDRPMTWLPVPSNIPVVADSSGVDAWRARVAPRGETIVGSFGTFGGAIGALLSEILPPLLEGQGGRVGLLLGRGGEDFAARLSRAHPALAGRLIAPGGLPPDEISLALRACDLLVQPYPDGVTCRRTTTMAALAHGVATVSNAGALTEPIWAESGALDLAPGPTASPLIERAERLLNDPEAREALGASGRAAYDRHFSIERTLEILRAGEPAGSTLTP